MPCVGDIRWLRQPPLTVARSQSADQFALDHALSDVYSCERSSDTPSKGNASTTSAAPAGWKDNLMKAHNQSGLYFCQGGICLRLGHIGGALARRLIDC
jgi:hypothetical protein